MTISDYQDKKCTTCQDIGYWHTNGRGKCIVNGGCKKKCNAFGFEKAIA